MTPKKLAIEFHRRIDYHIEQATLNDTQAEVIMQELLLEVDKSVFKSYANKKLMAVLSKLPLQDTKQTYTWIGARDIIQQEMESL